MTYTPPPGKLPVAVLGATGAVGQRLVAALAAHPWFELAEVAASERNVDRRYGEAAPWRLLAPMPEAARDMVLRHADPVDVSAPLVFSALDTAQAQVIEPRFADAGRAVVSNAAAHRMGPDVPLVVPEVNPEHLALIDSQRQWRGGSGFIACNPNCSVIGLVLALAPLARAARLTRACVTTLQAASGAGYPGVPALDLIDNVVPLIAGEEPKIAAEPAKIFGTLDGARIAPYPLTLSVQVHRVPVSDGHLLSVALESEPQLTPGQAAELIDAFRGAPQELGLPSAPARAVQVCPDGPRPQPLFDRDAGAGMTVSVGRLRPCPVLGLRMEALVHNTIRGAAGGTLLLGELIAARGYLP